VLLFHAGFGWARGGYLGVSAFFTLSGFLITTLLLTEWRENGRISLRRFWARRLRRLMPAAFVGLAGIVAFGALAANGDQLRELRGDVLAALGYMANWRLIFSNQSYADLFAAPSPVLHFWSLAIEEQFYLCFPLIAVGALQLGKRRGLGALTLALVLGAAGSGLAGLLLLRTGASADRLYYGTDTRVLELLVGALLAVGVARYGLPRQKSVQALGLLALLAMLGMWVSLSQFDRMLHRGGLVIHAVLAASVVLAAIQPNGPVRAVLRLELLRKLGLISYGVYVFHWPIFLWLDEERTGLPRPSLFTLRVVVTLAIAVLSYLLLERPIRDGRRLTDWRPWVVPPAIAGAVCLALVVVTLHPPSPLIVYGAVRRALPPAAPAPSASPAPPAGLSDDPAPAPGPLRILVVGDSVGETVGRGLERWGLRTGAAIVHNRAMGWCAIGRGGVVLFNGRAVDQAGGCSNWSRWDVESFRPDVVVVLSTIWEIVPRSLPRWDGARRIGDPAYDRWLTSEYVAATSYFSSHGAKVAWLTAPCTESNDAEGAIGRLNQMISTLPGAVAAGRLRVIDLFAHVCPAGRFVQRLGNVDTARPDGLHFSVAGADWLADWLGPELVDTPSTPVVTGSRALIHPAGMTTPASSSSLRRRRDGPEPI
jgi:peptidoglycan/LPS O-acetylase OafA/YrhL